MPADDAYIDAAHAMIAAAERGAPVGSVLRRRTPHIYRQLVAARACPQLLSLWGRSVNFDEHAKQEIVHPAILQAIGELAGVPMRGRIVHSGLQHTYGYLFSLIETPFGYKRERWISPALDESLGFAAPTLRDEPANGTLLTNLTYFLGRIAFGDRPRELRLLERDPQRVADTVRIFAYERLKRRRLIEEIDLPKRRIVLHTDLVCLSFAASGEDNLLIYSVVAGVNARPKLLTTFPVTAKVADEITRKTGRHLKVRLRFNAYVAGFPRQPVPGRRYLV